MKILIDYDNIHIRHRRQGLDYLVDKVIRNIGFSRLESTQRCSIRLYGGWYELDKLTRVAQILAAQIMKDFPKPITIVNEEKKHTLTVNVELAYSLAMEPSRHLWHTYRPRSLPPNLVCIHPSSVGCTDLNCPIENIYQFFKHKSCPNTHCEIEPEDILQKPEQKLVDTMITVDLIHYATKPDKQDLCIVSSDDDLLPGIISALFNGARILHVLTHPKRKTPESYIKGLRGDYCQMKL